LCYALHHSYPGISLSVFPIVLLLCLFVAVIWLQLIVKLRFILIGRFSNCQYQFSIQGNRTFTNYHVVWACLVW
jgi:hypothetical protein